MDDRIVIVDTNVLSFIFKGLRLGHQYSQLLARFDVRISFVTEAELQVWAIKSRWGARRRRELDLFLIGYPTIPYVKGMAKRYAEVIAEGEWAGRPIAWGDGWIATAALWHDIALVTHDSDFDRIPKLHVLNAPDVRPVATRIDQLCC
ncbi:MAG: PIN domain-containing protein [Gammaproteobacteria bacterium]